MNYRRRAGFTMIEMLVVIFIIGVLATILLFNFSNAKGKSNYSKTLSDLNAVAKALGMYSAANNGSYPASSLFNDSRLTQYLPAMPKTVCKDYEYFYYNNSNQNNIDVSVLFKHNTPDVFLYYINVNNFTVTNINTSIKPINIYDVPEKSFKCDAYKAFIS